MSAEKPPQARFRTRRIFLAGTLAALFAAVPAARAMVASVNGAETHHSDYATANTDIFEIWNRTVRFDGGTGTYLGKSADGTHYVLTANHVNVNSSASIAGADGTTHSLTVGKSDTLAGCEADAKYADLKVVAVSADAATNDFLNSLGAIGIFDPGEGYVISASATLYTAGTGCASSIGKNYDAGTRQKEWATFCRDDNENAQITLVPNGSETKTRCYLEKFSKSGTSFQGCIYDSGSGVFVYDHSLGRWLLVGTVLAVAGTPTESKKIGYIEDASADNPLTCATYFADLAFYADQIGAIMAIPEPSAFGLPAGTLALAFAAARRRRRAR